MSQDENLLFTEQVSYIHSNEVNKVAKTGDRIREIREKRGWKLDDLVEKSGLSKGFLSDVENNKRDISSQNLLRIANALGASVDYLLKGQVVETKESAPVVIPSELSLLAEEQNLTYSEILLIKDAHDAIIARRRSKGQKPFTLDDWRRLHQAIKKVFDRR
jgi:transcriptional regulator with XRE-family HTH domain